MKSHLVLIAASLLPVAALAQTPGEPPAPGAQPPSMAEIFRSLDTDQNGSISATEAQASPVVSGSFDKADADGDGGITEQEFSQAFTMRAPGSPPASPPPATTPPE
ncbi:MAG TPA: EF-hand domain-containing protein [Steroidobacteraceae bacterium]